jgi:hypothetical protein
MIDRHGSVRSEYLSELSRLCRSGSRSARKHGRPGALGWAISVLHEAGAIRECEEHGWTQDRADPHASERAFDIARRGPPAGITPDEAVAEIRDVLDSIGDTCPECPPKA